MPGIDTPIGRFQLTCSAVSGEPQCSVAEGGARVWAWSRADLDAEVWVGRVEPALPEGMAVSDCYAAIWRVRAKRALSGCEFICMHEGERVIGAGDACSGQGLEAQEWSGNGYTVTVGTQTIEAMIAHRRKGGSFPLRLARDPQILDAFEVALVEYLPYGFVVRPPALQQGEMIQVQFVVAWVPEKSDSTASWFAVNYTPPGGRG